MNEATNIGYVLMSLASLVGLALGMRTLIRGGNSNGSVFDVTRREFEELKTLTHSTLNQLNEQLLQLNIALAEIRTVIKGSGKS